MLQYLKNYLNIVYTEFKKAVVTIHKIILIRQVMEFKHVYVYIILFWIVLYVKGYISEIRILNFLLVILCIALYKILHKNIWKMYVKGFNKEKLTENEINILLKIYKYKNPLILLIIKLEEKWFNIMYDLTKIKEIKPFYINIIYNLMYNLTGYNGIKIILNKIYEILVNWKNYSIYEIIFKRIYGMILSILIFTNVLQTIFWILKSLPVNFILWIYIILILISYISNIIGLPKDIISLESSRMKSNLLGTILKESEYTWHKINKNTKIRLNQELKKHLWFIYDKDYKKFINYENLLKYRALQIGSSFKNKWIEYSNKPSFFYFNEMIDPHYGVFWINYIITKYNKLQKIEKSNIDQKVLIYCEYKILIYKLRIFYIWDVESWLGIQETNYKIITEYDKHPFSDEELTMLSYEYKNQNMDKIYQVNLSNNNIKNDKFWDLQENYTFYEKMHTYLYDNSDDYKNLEEECQENMFGDIALKNQLKEWRLDWEKYGDQELIKKYLEIMKEIDNIKRYVR